MKCGIIKRARSSNSNTEEFIEKAIKVHGNLYDYSLTNYLQAKKKVNIICKKHGPFKQIPASHLRGRGCPNCRRSLGEDKIKKNLIKRNVDFKIEKTFSDLINPGTKIRLKFDFYLPKKDMVIEYDGPQHFMHVNFSGKMTEKEMELSLKKLQEADRLKNKYCERKGIKMVRISYRKFDEIAKIIKQLDL